MSFYLCCGWNTLPLLPFLSSSVTKPVFADQPAWFNSQFLQICDGCCVVRCCILFVYFLSFLLSLFIYFLHPTLLLSAPTTKQLFSGVGSCFSCKEQVEKREVWWREGRSTTMSWFANIKLTSSRLALLVRGKGNVGFFSFFFSLVLLLHSLCCCGHLLYIRIYLFLSLPSCSLLCLFSLSSNVNVYHFYLYFISLSLFLSLFVYIYLLFISGLRRGGRKNYLPQWSHTEHSLPLPFQYSHHLQIQHYHLPSKESLWAVL